MRIRNCHIVVLATLLALAACKGDRNDQDGARGSNANTQCDGSCASASSFLSSNDVELIVRQAVAQARALNVPATVAVADRSGNILTVFRMTEVLANGDRKLTLISNQDTVISGGLERLELPISATVGGDALAAMAKAITAAYLSSEGNGFSTRVAGQIVQEHFNPGEFNQPSGPLFGVQFSQLPCSDFVLDASDPSILVGPKRSPLGLSADPGGIPLYKFGTPVGGIGVISDDFVYGIDRNISNVDFDSDEIIALAGSFGFAVPANRQADRITVDGKTLRFADIDFNAIDPSVQSAPVLVVNTDGSFVSVKDYYDANDGYRAGQAFGQPSSGIRSDNNLRFPSRDAFVFVDKNNVERFPPTAGSQLSATEVQEIINQALSVANRARAQIRQPLGSSARVTISVVDTDGSILGIARTRDAPIFGSDVSLQKARTATFFSSTDAANFLNALPDAQYLTPALAAANTIVLGDYVQNVINLTGDATALSNGIAFADRSGGNLSRPHFPDGIDANGPGPFSKPAGEWSPFSTGLQLDLSFNGIVSHLLYLMGGAQDVNKNCVGLPFAGTTSSAAPRLANGIQIFPGSVPIYRGSQLIGGIGVSGDGVDQDDMIAFLGLHQAGEILGTVNNAPAAIRADQLAPRGQRLRYISCPQSPFNNSDEQNVCAGK
ncbi:heme-binding protein [Zhongshania sp. BJYM1]|uniref:heme-binding protein n=1 Tax=Zhongshania aquatica TaxID=2965069 RepID=UPI0022B4B6DF|nr:heme-binding protein [Marortus sp. BJYM1]